MLIVIIMIIIISSSSCSSSSSIVQSFAAWDHRSTSPSSIPHWHVIGMACRHEHLISTPTSTYISQFPCAQNMQLPHAMRCDAMKTATSIGWHYLSNATCLIQASFVLCVFRRVKARHNCCYVTRHA